MLSALLPCSFLLSLGAPSLVAGADAEIVFAPPVRLEANGVPIDVTIGHAAPYVIDFDGDGVRDLLVGEFGDVDFPVERLPKRLQEAAKKSSYSQGKLRIYRNHGSDEEPLFKDFEYLRAGREDASMPTT
ncbi:MAG: hypothetical protein DSY81_03755 [Bacillota bacterium]|nr:MAG: hypothetical protein DSY81_03755 [Bacillota bacterium]